MQQYVKNAI